MAEDGPGRQADPPVDQQVEDAHAEQPREEVEEEQDGGVRAAPRPVEAAGADQRHEDVHGPERAEAGQAQGPGGGQQEQQAAGGEEPLEGGPPLHQEVAAHGDQAEREDGHGVGDVEEQAVGPAAQPAASPPQVQVEVGGDGLQQRAVQQVGQRQVDDQHVEAGPDARVSGEGQDGHQVPHGASDRDKAPPQHGKVTVFNHQGVVAGEVGLVI